MIDEVSWQDLVKEKLETTLNEEGQRLLRACDFSEPKSVLDLFQALRARELVSGPVGFYLIAGQADEIVSEIARVKYRDYWDRVRQIESSLAFDQETGPYVEALEQYSVRRDGLFEQSLREIGEQSMADMLRDDSDQFDATSGEGEALIGIDMDIILFQPEWIRAFANAIWRCISGIEGFGGLDVACKGLVTSVQLLAGPTRVELLGDRLDGQMAWAAFKVDMVKLIQLFSTVDFVQWCSGSTEGPLSHGGLELFGTYVQHAVKVFVASEPIGDWFDPDRFSVVEISK